MPSSVIATYRYDKETSSLVVTFLSGAIYVYEDVPERVYLAMKQTVSKGVFLNVNVKGHYRFRKVNQN